MLCHPCWMVSAQPLHAHSLTYKASNCQNLDSATQSPSDAVQPYICMPQLHGYNFIACSPLLRALRLVLASCMKAWSKPGKDQPLLPCVMPLALGKCTTSTRACSQREVTHSSFHCISEADICPGIHMDQQLRSICTHLACKLQQLVEIA